MRDRHPLKLNQNTDMANDSTDTQDPKGDDSSPSPCSHIPAIESAYLNLGTALNDIEMARVKWEDDDMADAAMWIGNAIAQLESAKAKVEKYISANDQDHGSPEIGSTKG